MRAPLQKDDKWVVAVATMLGLIVISFFTLQKFWPGADEPTEAAATTSSSTDDPNKGDDDIDESNEHNDLFWDEVKGQKEVNVWLYGSDEGMEEIASSLVEHWPGDTEANIHNESDGSPFFIDAWLKIVTAEPISENSWVLLKWDQTTAGELATLESALRQLLAEQPQLAVTVIADEGLGGQEDVDALIEAYNLSWGTSDQLPAQLSEMSLAHLPDDPLYGGVIASDVERIEATDLFYGPVELRPLSSDDRPFTFDQYYALMEPDGRVDYEVEGEQVGIVYLSDSNGGSGTLELDGEVMGELDSYSEDLSQGVAWIPLNDGDTHTLSIKYGGTSGENAPGSQVFIQGLIVVK